MDDQLIGRERERALLQAWVTEALAGRGSLVLVAGEAGVGKTTLARRVLAGSGLEVLEGFGAQGGAAAFGPIVAVLRSSLRSAGGRPAARGAAGRAPGAAAPRARPRHPPRRPRDPVRGRPPDPGGDRRQGRPTALFLDDLQWADDATLELLGGLARSVGDQPLLIVGAFRSDELPRGHSIRRARSELRRAGHLRQVTVEPLGAEAPPSCWNGRWGRRRPRCGGRCSTGPTASPSS